MTSSRLPSAGSASAVSSSVVPEPDKGDPAAKPRILVLSLGGTISCASSADGREMPRAAGSEIVDTAPAIHEMATVTVVDVTRTGSIGVGPADVAKLARLVRDAQSSYDGVVVTQGTDAIEETSYALSLQVRAEVPVVLTGAMRTPKHPGSDGPANLLAAFAVACDAKATPLGPVVVIQDEIHLARFVAKQHTARVAPFQSAGLGPVGEVTEGRAHIWAHPAYVDYVGEPPALDRRVELAWVALGADAASIEGLARGADGLVIAAAGGGHVPPAMVDALRRLVRGGLPVVMASRTIAGTMLEATYTGPGTESDLLALGVHSAGALAPLKARWRLAVALACGRPVNEVFPVY